VTYLGDEMAEKATGGEVAEKVLDDKELARVRMSPNARMPSRAYDGDAGYDLYYSGRVPMLISPGQVTTIPSEVAIEWPPDMWGLIIGRSSSFEKGLLVNPTVIDAGFRGDLFAYVRNVNTDWVEVKPDDRIAQIVPMPLLAPGVVLAEAVELSPSDRGSNGFGSSGR
jgi:dUTP pyrophosphatase